MGLVEPFGLPAGEYGAILADPPWRFKRWNNVTPVQSRTSNPGTFGGAAVHYETMSDNELVDLPIGKLAADNCALFLWVSWPKLQESLSVMDAWGFTYKTCAFCWTKAHAGQLEMFEQNIPDQMGMGYWTRANTEVCLLATRGKPKRLNADVRQAIIQPRREHSRKPEGVHARIERLVAGRYVELFARTRRPNWDCWGDQVDKFQVAK